MVIKLFENRINKIPEIFNTNRFASLDGLRAISIFLVILSHINYNSNNVIKSLDLGSYGVNIFFTISGFLITTLLLKEKVKTESISLKNFYIRRVLRIFPVAYLFIITLIILNLIFNLHIPTFSFISSALYLRNVSSLEGDWYTGHFWSLSTEEQYYLIFPFLIYVLSLRKYIIVLIIAIIASPILNLLVAHHLLANPLFITLNAIFRNMPQILIGSLVSSLIFLYGLPLIIEKLQYRGWVSILLFLCAGVFQTGMISIIPSSLIGIIVSCCICLLIIINLPSASNLTFRFLNYGPVMYIGTLSYSLYIWQQLFTFHQPWEHLFKGSDSLILNGVLLILVSYISYNYYEKKFLELKDKFGYGNKTNE